MKVTLNNSNDQEFVYEWNGSETVNVSTRDVKGELVNFDVFTFDEPPETVQEVIEACRRHQKYGEEADFRYTEELPREILLYGS